MNASLHKQAILAIFGDKAGTKLLNWLDPCCPQFCNDVNACVSTPPLSCAIVKNCLGISEAGDPDLLLNQQGNWVATTVPSGGVTNVNGKTGPITIAAGPGIGVVTAGQIVTISATAGALQYAKVDIPATQLNASFSTPVIVLPALGPNLFYQVLSVYARYTLGSSVYNVNGNNTLNLGWLGGTIPYFTGAAINIGVSHNASWLFSPVGSMADVYNAFVNAAFVFTTDVANLSGGDGTLTLYISYTVNSI